MKTLFWKKKRPEPPAVDNSSTSSKKAPPRYVDSYGNERNAARKVTPRRKDKEAPEPDSQCEQSTDGEKDKDKPSGSTDKPKIKRSHSANKMAPWKRDVVLGRPKEKYEGDMVYALNRFGEREAVSIYLTLSKLVNVPVCQAESDAVADPEKTSDYRLGIRLIAE